MPGVRESRLNRGICEFLQNCVCEELRKLQREQLCSLLAVSDRSVSGVEGLEACLDNVRIRKYVNCTWPKYNKWERIMIDRSVLRTRMGLYSVTARGMYQRIIGVCVSGGTDSR
jgi:hypothetical protein